MTYSVLRYLQKQPILEPKKMFRTSVMSFVNSRRQRERPLTSSWLRKRARHCNFVATLDENLQNQLIEKLLDVELKKKLLDVNKITLEAAMDKVLKWDRSLTCAGESNGHAKPRTWNRH